MIKKTLCLILCACLAGCALSGCNPFRKGGQDASDDTEPELVYGTEPEEEPSDPGMTEDEARKAFETLDRSMAAWYAGLDGFLFRTVGQVPDGMTGIPYTFEDLSLAAQRTAGMQASDFLERLSQIPRSLLTDAQRTDYDVLTGALGVLSSLSTYDYRKEPLSLYDGALTGLYLQFLSMEVRTPQQAEEYLVLLSAYASHLDAILAYEQAKAGQGMFMTESALDAVLGLLSSMTAAGTSGGLYAAFEEQVRGSGSAIPDAQKDAYIARCSAVMTGRVLPALGRLSDGLSGLRASCRKDGGTGSYGSDGKAYYALRLQQETGTAFTPDEFLDRVEDLLWAERYRLMELRESGPAAGTGTSNGAAYTYRTGIAELMRITQLLSPGASMPEVYTVRVPDEISLPEAEDAVLSCMASPYRQERVAVPKRLTDPESFLSLAESAYPLRYFLAGSDGWTRPALRIPGSRALEGMLSEEIAEEKQILFAERAVREARILRRIAALACAAVSVRVNLYDYSKESVRIFTDSLQLDLLDGYGDALYRLAVDEPYCGLSTASGICLSEDLLTRDLNGDAERLFRTAAEIGNSTYGPLLERILIRMALTES